MRFVHVSTDFVFDGTKDGAYTEDDEPNPLSVYGASKLAGERAVVWECPRRAHRAHRVGLRPGRRELPGQDPRRGARARARSVVTDEIGSPTYTLDLARGHRSACWMRTRHRAVPPGGLGVLLALRARRRGAAPGRAGRRAGGAGAESARFPQGGPAGQLGARLLEGGGARRGDAAVARRGRAVSRRVVTPLAAARRRAPSSRIAFMAHSVDAIVVNYNTAELLRACLSSIRGFRYAPSSVFVVDNASSDGSAEMVRQHFPEVQLSRWARTLASRGRTTPRSSARTRTRPAAQLRCRAAPDALGRMLASSQASANRHRRPGSGGRQTARVQYEGARRDPRSSASSGTSRT